MGRAMINCRLDRHHDATKTSDEAGCTAAMLDCGMRAVHISRKADIEICGVAIRVGSRDEDAAHEGLAHFVEHTIFKGTSRRRASQIINRMESVGGELNAYTTKEETYVYSICPKGFFSRAAELIADLAANSVFPDAELDREREVVAEEIDSYLDTPSEAVYDDFEDMIFRGDSLGHNILGSQATLRTFSSATCREFIRRYYVASNMVFFYLGPQSHSKVFAEASRHFSLIPQGVVTHLTDAKAPTLIFTERRDAGDNHQAHTIVGATTPSLYSPERYAFALYNNIIGGPGMNSRLNVILRERRGLVYSVESSIALYSDTGLLTIYFGCNPEDLSRCRRLVANELSRLADAPLSQSALDRAKRQYIGQLVVASASLEQTILSAARAMLFLGRVNPSSATREAILSVTPEDLHRAAIACAPDRLSTLTLG